MSDDRFIWVKTRTWSNTTATRFEIGDTGALALFRELGDGTERFISAYARVIFKPETIVPNVDRP